MEKNKKINKNHFLIPLKFRGKPFLGLAQLSKIFWILSWYIHSTPPYKCVQKVNLPAVMWEIIMQITLYLSSRENLQRLGSLVSSWSLKLSSGKILNSLKEAVYIIMLVDWFVYWFTHSTSIKSIIFIHLRSQGNECVALSLQKCKLSHSLSLTHTQWPTKNLFSKNV